MEFQVSLTPKAKQDLAQIGRYIALDDEGAAHRFSDELTQVAVSLCQLPRRGHRFSRHPDILRVVHKSYLILYRVDEPNRQVEILRFWHAAQDRKRLRLREMSGSYGIPVAQV